MSKVIQNQNEKIIQEEINRELFEFFIDLFKENQNLLKYDIFQYLDTVNTNIEELFSECGIS